MNNKKPITFLILLIHIFALIVYHIFGYTGHFGYDDLHYAQLAVDFNNGILNFEDHFTYRFPVIILTALSYSIFGVSDFASSLPPIIFTILTLLPVFYFLKNENYLTLITGLSLTLFPNWFIFYSDKIMPDIYVAFSVIYSLFIIAKYKFKSNKKNSLLYSVLLALALLFGFMAKGTIVLIMPLLLYLTITDLILWRDIKFWLLFLVNGLLILSAYFAFIWLLTGDFGKRFEALTNNSYLNLCSYNRQPLKILLERISYGFIRLLTIHGMLINFVFVFIFIFRNRFRIYYRFDNPFSFFLVAAALLFISSNFMSISLTSYSPMCLDPRHYLLLVPVAAIPAAQILQLFIFQKKYKYPVFFVFAMLSVWSWFLPGDVFFTHYLPLTLLFAFYILLKKANYSQPLFVFLFIFILLIIPFEAIRYAQKIKYRKQRQILIEQVLEKYNNATVITNEVQKRLGNYYLNFNKKYSARFLSFEEFVQQPKIDRLTLLFLNPHTRYLSGKNLEDLPYFVRNIAPENNLLFEDQKLKISIYKLNTISEPATTGIELLHSFNGFEGQPVYWNKNEENRNERIKYEGNHSVEVEEFSPAFSFPLDSLPLNQYNQIVVKCSLYCNYEDKSKSSLVISVEDKEQGSYIYNALKVEKQIKAWSSWWPVVYETEINTTDIKKASVLKVYLWNIDKKPVYIDNFDVKIIGMVWGTV